MTSPILVTGAGGFIGFHTAIRLLERGERVVGLDNLNRYYDVRLKEAKLPILSRYETFTFLRQDIADRDAMKRLFDEHGFERVINLAAQPGVRYSLEHPHTYVDSNIVGFMNILEGCRQAKSRHLVYASSSSVYGANERLPFSEHDNVDHPMSLYAATKKANELMAHSYSSLYQLPTTGLRFFTVYGPWGRPDMAFFLFTNKIYNGEPIQLFNFGRMVRDFTYVDDIVEGVVKVLDAPPQGSPEWSGTEPDPSRSYAPYRVFNIGNHERIELARCVAAIEDALGMKAKVEYQPIQPGDVLATEADVKELESAVGFAPDTSIEEGARRFVEWYRSVYVPLVAT